MNDIYSELDPGIADVVQYLRSCGFGTISSCQGGDGHAFPFPTVVIQGDYYDNKYEMLNERDRLAEVLIRAGYSGFYISLVWAYQSDAVAWDGQGPYIELEFWALVDGEVPRKVTT